MGTNFPRTATHVIDFSPGDTGSIGHLMTHNLNGCVIVGGRARVVLRFMTHGMFSMKIGYPWWLFCTAARDLATDLSLHTGDDSVISNAHLQSSSLFMYTSSVNVLAALNILLGC